MTSAWFPSDRSTSGVFVKEQAEALARIGYQVTFLIVEHYTVRSFIKRLTRHEGGIIAATRSILYANVQYSLFH